MFSRLINSHAIFCYMMADNKNILLSLSDVNNLELLQKLIVQLNKDSKMSGLDWYFDLTLKPEDLFKSLEEKIRNTLIEDPGLFSNLMYRIDISEEHIIKQSGFDLVETTNNIALMIIKREWQKVWFRNKNLPLE